MSLNEYFGIYILELTHSDGTAHLDERTLDPQSSAKDVSVRRLKKNERELCHPAVTSQLYDNMTC